MSCQDVTCWHGSQPPAPHGEPSTNQAARGKCRHTLPVLRPLRPPPQLQGAGYLGVTVLLAIALVTMQAHPVLVGHVSCLADAGPV